jgi:pimeloyl-ACP methyl ester carboxylesterase
MRTYIIYIPGLGDQYGWFRQWALMLWRLWGVTAIHQPITWYDGGSMADKLHLVQAAIDRVPADGRIVLVGESAGASLALHAAVRDSRVERVITLCGVARSDTPIAASLRWRAPALHQAVDTLPEVFDVDVVSVRAAVDHVVGKRYSSVAGAERRVIWSVGHMTTIILCLTVLAPIITAIAKKRKK